MTRVCAVATCTSSWFGGKGKKAKKKGVSFFKFPREKAIRNLWISKCRRTDAFDAEKAHVCSEHFSTKEYDTSYLLKTQFMLEGPHRPKLKPDAVPTENIPSVAPR